MAKERREYAKACWTLLRGDRRIGQHEIDRAWRRLTDDEALHAFFKSATADPDGIREERARMAARWTERHASLSPARRAGITRLPAVADLLDVWREWGEMILSAPPPAELPSPIGATVQGEGEPNQAASRPTMR